MRSVAAAVLAAALVGGGGAARADTATCDVPIVHALHNGDDGRAPEIDSKIHWLKPYLEKAPFTAWREFKLLDRKSLTIGEGTASTFVLPNGRDAALTFVSHMAGPGDHRLRLKLAIDDKSKKSKVLDTTFVLDEGGVVLFVGQKHQGGVLLLAVSCKTHD